MARKLRTNVTVHRRDEHGDPTGESVTVGPDHDLSQPEYAWVEDAITNPDVWEDSAEDSPRPPDPGNSGGVADAEKATGDSPPPKVGKGSGQDAWVAYAKAHGVHPAEGDKREDIIAALDAAGVRTE